MPIALLRDIYVSKSELTEPLRNEMKKVLNTIDVRPLTKKLESGEKELVALQINPPTDLNFLDRKEIFSARNDYVSKSLFASKGYNPENSPVLSGIQSGKPWLGLFAEGNPYCISNKINEGVSEESRFLNNPNILAGIALGYANTCAKKEDKPAEAILPRKLSWSSDLNTVIVEYNFSDYYKITLCAANQVQRHDFRLTGINARDLGYPYVYADELENIIFKEKNNNISSKPAHFLDYIHVGPGCGLQGGCNNGSPLQTNIFFYLNKLPAHTKTSMRLKLWKKEPLSPMAPADTNLLMIFK